MKTILRTLIFSLVVFTARLGSCLFQERSPTTYPYGGVPDSSSFIQQSTPNVEVGLPLNFAMANFDSAYFHEPADFDLAQFASRANFYHAYFLSTASFIHANFSGVANFTSANFNKSVGWAIASFDTVAWFSSTHFYGLSHFLNTQFNEKVYFWGARFYGFAYFQATVFNDLAGFLSAQFDSASFKGTRFNNSVSFESALFNEVDFSYVTFTDTVDFRSTQFQKGVDFRLANFDKVRAIYLEKLRFPIGQLYCYRDQFMGNPELRIKIVNPLNREDNYLRIEVIYKLLRDNFLAQGDQVLADEVMHELGQQRKEILCQFWWKMYGWFFGYGYKPWRFLLFVVLPLIIAFAFIWYRFYYGILAPILCKELPSNLVTIVRSKERTKQIMLLRKLVINIYDHSTISKDITFLARFWHVIFFSASVLLGIRFKKDWINVGAKQTLGHKSFLTLVTVEWLLGIGLYIAFGVLVRGSHFEYIKGLLGL